MAAGWEFAMGAMIWAPAPRIAKVRVACQFDQASAEPITEGLLTTPDVLPRSTAPAATSP